MHNLNNGPNMTDIPKVLLLGDSIRMSYQPHVAQMLEGQAEVVLLEKGEEEDEYKDLEVEGKLVLTNGDLRQVWRQAVHKRGAIGILYDGMRPVNPVRPVGDLPDVRQYTSFWWQPGDTKCFGFVLTPRQGQSLRSIMKALPKLESVQVTRSQVNDAVPELREMYPDCDFPY